MRKREFLNQLEKRLNMIRKAEIDEIVRYYDELIQDAVDNGETENDFIAKLGSVDDIVKTIQEDENFITKIRERSEFTIRNAIGTTTRIIGRLIFAFVSFVLVVIAFSFAVSGFASAVYATVLVFIETDVSTSITMMRVGNAILGVGLLLIAIGLMKWYFDIARRAFDKLLQEIEKRLRKESE
ncbi:MAG: DUF1700 domain-containing protein [Bacilli bacterium]|nr:DUF1700 domain-containing protein [Bacilli bacterium]MBN2696842.1 DUF1700 domain-containing protein [Bacilli bacterium]